MSQKISRDKLDELDELDELISPIFLEKAPKKFLENLITCNRHRIDISDYINDTGKYNCWFSSLPMCLYYLVGDLTGNGVSYFYGQNTKINEILGIEIMAQLWIAGANMAIKNYYNNNIYEEIQDEEDGKATLTTRKNNESFIEFIKFHRVIRTVK